MRFSWLAPALLVGGGAATGIVSDKVFSSEGRVVVKGIQNQRLNRNPEDASIVQLPSADAITVDLGTIDLVSPNRTKPQLVAQANEREEASDPEQDAHPEELATIALRSSNSASPDQKEPPTRLSSDSGHDPDPDTAATSAANGAGKTGNPASANRAIAGMGVGLVSVMLIFTIFL
ncbi:hypothetical protein VTI28DRAFT_3330 [Corynascus sepedonium]